MRMLPAVLVSCLVGHSAWAVDWTRASSPHITLYTTTGEQKARDVLLQFETLRTLFFRNHQSAHPGVAPLTVIVFGSARDYEPFRIGPYSAAFYQYTSDEDFIVLGDLKGETFPIAAHEFMHLVIERSGIRLPVWLNEGLAELYSTVHWDRRRIRIGQPVAGHLRVLRRGGYPDVGELIALGRDTLQSRRREHAAAVYATSWALAHMLMLSEGYRDRWAEFFRRAAGGEDSTSLFQRMYGKTPGEIGNDLKSYLSGGVMRPVDFERDDEPVSAPTSVGSASEGAAGAVLARLLRTGDRKKEARELLETLQANWPTEPAIHAELGYLARAEGDYMSALGHFRLAAAEGTMGAQFHYDYGMEEWRSGNAEAAGPELRTALTLSPDFVPAGFQLAVWEVSRGRYEQALNTIESLPALPPEQASKLVLLTAHCRFQLGRREAAEEAARRAATLAETEEDRRAAFLLLHHIALFPPVPATRSLPAATTR